MSSSSTRATSWRASTSRDGVRIARRPTPTSTTRALKNAPAKTKPLSLSAGKKAKDMRTVASQARNAIR
jgi:hypothetical protein